MANESTSTNGCPYGCPLCCLYQMQKACQAGIKEVVPQEVRHHLNEAARELLLAFQGWVKSGLERLTEEPKPGSRRKAQRVKVE